VVTTITASLVGLTPKISADPSCPPTTHPAYCSGVI
jgi:hypothetical protein